VGVTPAELAAFSIGFARVSNDDDDEEQTNDDEEMEDERVARSISSLRSSFPFWCFDDEGGEESCLY
jgi:hypothetical protein